MLVCSSEAYLFYFYIFTKLSFIFPFIPVSTLGKDSDPSRRAEPATIYGRLSMRARLQQYVNCELPDVQAGFRKDRRTRDQIANIRRIIEKAREFQKNIYFCLIDCAKAFDCVDHNKLRKILQEMGIPEYLTCLWRNLYAGEEATLELDMEQQTGSK